MNDFLNNMFENENFVIFLVVALILLVILFILFFILGKKDQKMEITRRIEKIEETKRLNYMGDTIKDDVKVEDKKEEVLEETKEEKIDLSGIETKQDRFYGDKLNGETIGLIEKIEPALVTEEPSPFAFEPKEEVSSETMYLDFIKKESKIKEPDNVEIIVYDKSNIHVNDSPDYSNVTIPAFDINELHSTVSSEPEKAEVFSSVYTDKNDNKELVEQEEDFQIKDYSEVLLFDDTVMTNFEMPRLKIDSTPVDVTLPDIGSIDFGGMSRK